MDCSSSEEEWSSLFGFVSEAIDLEASARQSGALSRRRQIKSAQDLLRLCMVYGPGGQSLNDTAIWARLEGVADLSKTAVLYRIRDSADWLCNIAAALLAHNARSVEQQPRRTWLGRRLRLVDGSSITAPGQGQDWRLHAVYDLGGQRFDQLELTAKSQGESLQRVTAVAGDLIVADRLYARPKDLQHIQMSGADFLVRMGRRSLRLQHPDGTAFDLEAILARSKAEGGVDCAVHILNAKSKDWTPLPARLVIIPKPAEAAQTSRTKALRGSQQGGHQNDPLSLEAAEHLMLITSLPADQASPDQLMAAYRLRWQIELGFKRLKTLLHIDRLPAKEPGLAKAWLAAHLIAALLIERIVPQLRDSPP